MYVYDYDEKGGKSLIAIWLTLARSSAVAEKPRDALYHLISSPSAVNSRNNSVPIVLTLSKTVSITSASNCLVV